VCNKGTCASKIGVRLAALLEWWNQTHLTQLFPVPQLCSDVSGPLPAL